MAALYMPDSYCCTYNAKDFRQFKAESGVFMMIFLDRGIRTLGNFLI